MSNNLDHDMEFQFEKHAVEINQLKAQLKKMHGLFDIQMEFSRGIFAEIDRIRVHITQSSLPPTQTHKEDYEHLNETGKIQGAQTWNTVGSVSVDDIDLESGTETMSRQALTILLRMSQSQPTGVFRKSPRI
jgi:hypothetical protein